MKKTNNKGFSLVELIVVIAIMAVLMGVLAPQFLKYVEKSRTQKDESAAGEVLNATKIALADEKILNELKLTDETSAVVTVGDNVDITVTPPTGGAATLLVAELKSTIGTVDFVSTKHNGNSFTVTITYDGSNYIFTPLTDWGFE